MKIVNCTPHPINIIDESNRMKTVFYPSGRKVRLDQKLEQIGTIDADGVDIPETKTRFADAEDLPPRKENTIYIVSLVVCNAYKERDDFYIVNEVIRDDAKRILGCKSISQNPFFSL
jgi:hypothetical protein